MAHSAKGEFLGHPKGLYILFFTEMWERFSYYGMRALLVLYMVNYFKWTQADASSIYKWYTSLVYLTPLLGGYLADRYLGNKRAIIIGAILMSIGHFCMAFEQIEIFYMALIFLIVGNGFFKPNMSVQVGRLYPTNDPRRDSAYTIFYMGINLGAFLSPLVCGWLRENTEWGFHAGFTAAGIGMLLGLVVYLWGLKWVEEIPEGVTYQGPEVASQKKSSEDEHYMTEAEAATAPSIFPRLAAASPVLLKALAVICIAGGLSLWLAGFIKMDNAVALILGGGCSCIMGSWIVGKLQMAVRDRVLAIYVVAVFVVFFWGAFEQAGSAMTLFADQTTERFITQEAPPPSLYPVIKGAESLAVDSETSSWWQGWMKLWNPVSTEWFQSINALAIFLLAPLFAWLWLFLPSRGIKLSIPAKITIGVFMQAAAFMLMWNSVTYENQPSTSALTTLPSGLTTEADGKVVFRDAPNLENKEAFEEFNTSDLSDAEMHVVNGGRIYFNQTNNSLDMNGVLAYTDRERILRATVSESYLNLIRELADKSSKTKATSEGEFSVSVEIPTLPLGFDLRYAGFADDKVYYDEAEGTLVSTVELMDKDYKALLVAGADPVFRDAMNDLYITSAKFRVSSWWLFWFYILCTVGELCLSPVGLSMVSKLAPAKFATMLMGMWLLTSFFGNFLAGFAGESYGTIHPSLYFILIAAIVGAASFVCLLTVKTTKKMMHGVN